MPSIIVTKFPSVILPARNPVYFELMSSPNLGTGHIIFKSRFFYMMPENDGASYTFSSSTLNLKFYFVAKPVNEFQLQAWDGRMKLDEWLDLTTIGFQKCGALASQYSVKASYVDSSIYIEALKEGDEFTMWFSQANSNVKITIESYGGEKGPGGSAKQNLRHGLQVWRGNGVQNYMVAEDLVTPVIENGMAVSRFDVSELLLPAVFSDVNLLSTGPDTLVNRRQISPPFFICYYEMYGDTPAIIEVLTSRWFFSLNGGIPPWMHVDFYSTWDNFYQYLNATQQYFLTWHWFPKPSDRDAPERLYVIVPTVSQDSKCTIEAVLFRKYHADLFSYDINQNLCTGEVYEIDANFRTLFQGLRDENIVGWEVRFRCGSFSTVSFRFNYDDRWLPNIRYFLFLNSLGAYECVRFTGETIYELAFQREYYEQSVLSTYKPNLVPRSQIPPDTKRQFKTNTGWISLEEVEWMQDFLNSTNVFEIKNGKQYPVLITLDKVETHRDNNNLYAMSIAFEYVDFPNVYQIDRETSWQDVAQVMDPYQQT